MEGGYQPKKGKGNGIDESKLPNVGSSVQHEQKSGLQAYIEMVRKDTARKIYNKIYDSIPSEEQFDFIRGIKFTMEIVEKCIAEVKK